MRREYAADASAAVSPSAVCLTALGPLVLTMTPILYLRLQRLQRRTLMLLLLLVVTVWRMGRWLLLGGEFQRLMVMRARRRGWRRGWWTPALRAVDIRFSRWYSVARRACESEEDGIMVNFLSDCVVSETRIRKFAYEGSKIVGNLRHMFWRFSNLHVIMTWAVDANLFPFNIRHSIIYIVLFSSNIYFIKNISNIYSKQVADLLDSITFLFIVTNMGLSNVIFYSPLDCGRIGRHPRTYILPFINTKTQRSTSLHPLTPTLVMKRTNCTYIRMGLLEKRYNRILDPTLCAYLLTLFSPSHYARYHAQRYQGCARERARARVSASGKQWRAGVDTLITGLRAAQWSSSASASP